MDADLSSNDSMIAPTETSWQQCRDQVDALIHSMAGLKALPPLLESQVLEWEPIALPVINDLQTWTVPELESIELDKVHLPELALPSLKTSVSISPPSALPQANVAVHGESLFDPMGLLSIPHCQDDLYPGENNAPLAAVTLYTCRLNIQSSNNTPVLNWCRLSRLEKPTSSDATSQQIHSLLLQLVQPNQPHSYFQAELTREAYFILCQQQALKAPFEQFGVHLTQLLENASHANPSHSSSYSVEWYQQDQIRFIEHTPFKWIVHLQLQLEALSPRLLAERLSSLTVRGQKTCLQWQKQGQLEREYGQAVTEQLNQLASYYHDFSLDYETRWKSIIGTIEKINEKNQNQVAHYGQSVRKIIEKSVQEKQTEINEFMTVTKNSISQFHENSQSKALKTFQEYKIIHQSLLQWQSAAQLRQQFLEQSLSSLSQLQRLTTEAQIAHESLLHKHQSILRQSDKRAQKINALQTSLDTLQMDFKKTLDKLSTAETGLASLQAQSAHWENKAEALQKDIQQANKIISKLQRQRDQDEHRLNDKQAQHQALLEQCSDLNLKLKEESNEKSKLKNLISDLEIELKKWQEKEEKWTTEKDSLQQEQKTNLQVIEWLHKQLAEKEKENLNTAKNVPIQAVSNVNVSNNNPIVSIKSMAPAPQNVTNVPVTLPKKTNPLTKPVTTVAASNYF